MADRVSSNLAAVKLPVKQQAGLFKRILGEMVDDALGVRGKPA